MQIELTHRIQLVGKLNQNQVDVIKEEMKDLPWNHERFGRGGTVKRVQPVWNTRTNQWQDYVNVRVQTFVHPDSNMGDVFEQTRLLARDFVFGILDIQLKSK